MIFLSLLRFVKSAKAHCCARTNVFLGKTAAITLGLSSSIFLSLIFIVFHNFYKFRLEKTFYCPRPPT